MNFLAARSQKHGNISGSSTTSLELNFAEIQSLCQGDEMGPKNYVENSIFHVSRHLDAVLTSDFTV